MNTLKKKTMRRADIIKKGISFKHDIKNNICDNKSLPIVCARVKFIFFFTDFY